MRRILVTGANKGIGRAIVAQILTRHADTFVWLGARSLARGEAARDGLLVDHPEWSQRLQVVQLDVTDDTSVAEAADTVTGEGRMLYGLVNNAGIGAGPLDEVLAVNTFGMRRVCEAFLPHVMNGGRVVNVTSAAGPSFVASLTPAHQAQLCDPGITWDALLGIIEALRPSEPHSYGLSKALCNAYTQLLARTFPALTINACTPGLIETDMTRPFAEARGMTPAEMGMKTPEEGAHSTMVLLFAPLPASGWYYGSDAERSPLDRYRSPGDPPFTGS